MSNDLQTEHYKASKKKSPPKYKMLLLVDQVEECFLIFPHRFKLTWVLWTFAAITSEMQRNNIITLDGKTRIPSWEFLKCHLCHVSHVSHMCLVNLESTVVYPESTPCVQETVTASATEPGNCSMFGERVIGLQKNVEVLPAIDKSTDSTVLRLIHLYSLFHAPYACKTLILTHSPGTCDSSFNSWASSSRGCLHQVTICLLVDSTTLRKWADMSFNPNSEKGLPFVNRTASMRLQIQTWKDL